MCEICGSPYLVRYNALPSPELKTRLRRQRWSMWRYDMWLPLADEEHPVTLGEGGTPLLALPRLAAHFGLKRLSAKDPSETKTVTFDYAREHPGATLTAPVVTPTVHAGVDATPSAVLLGSPQVQGQRVLQQVHGGVGGVDFVDYLLTCTATVNGGPASVRTAILPVRTL